MADSLSTRGRSLDVGAVGVDRESLPPFDAGPIDLRAWFAPERRNLPLELEVGSGKGTFLVQQAPLSPQVNYIGIEYARAFWRYAADRCRRHGLENVRIVHTEADFFLRNYVPDAALGCIHIYFPDPWPKKRHHKRRLIQAPLLRTLDRVLGPGGEVRIATDHEGYFGWMLEHAAAVSDRFEKLPFNTPGTAGPDELVGTNFERKYRREGRPFSAMVLRKRAGDDAAYPRGSGETGA